MTRNFTVGPVQSEEYTCSIGSEQVPYFRNDYFSNIVFESEKLLKKTVNADENAKVLFITGSGTAAMEATIINIFTVQDKLLIINGGSFGQRFVDICAVHGIPFIEIKVPFGHNITEDQLKEYSNTGITGLLINVDETSSGVRYNMDIVTEFCNNNDILLVADIISSYLADPNDMKKSNVDVYIIGSQKALACQPGVSILVLSPRAVKIIEKNNPKTFYLDLKNALKNAERGQTPFTPAVGIIRQIHSRLKHIDMQGGVNSEIVRVEHLAHYFREHLGTLPFTFVTETPSNAVTALYTNGISAKELFSRMYDEHDIWICPNGGQYAESVFRIGHIGNLSIKDYEYLIESLCDVVKQLG